MIDVQQTNTQQEHNNNDSQEEEKSRPPSETTITQDVAGHSEVYGELNANTVDVEGKY